MWWEGWGLYTFNSHYKVGAEGCGGRGGACELVGLVHFQLSFQGRDMGQRGVG